MADLARQFVCVRIQSMNGVNIGLFQFEYDLTWMAFFMDANDRFYARYGGREDHGPETHLNKASLLHTMREVLRLHREGKVQTSHHEPTGQPFKTPEDYATLRKRITARKPGNRCIHCHDVKMAQLEEFQAQGRFRKDLIFSYPMPSALGLQVDEEKQNQITAVKPGSLADKAGIRSGDVLLQADSQNILTVGDLARVLELTPREALLPLRIERNGQTRQIQLQLTGNWRTTADPSWRSSTHLAGPNGGFWAIPLNGEQKEKLGIPRDSLALRVNHFFPGNQTPVQAGLMMNDVIIELDGKRKAMNTRQMHTYLQMEHQYGDKVPIVVRRNGKDVQLVLPLQTKPAELR